MAVFPTNPSAVPTCLGMGTPVPTAPRTRADGTVRTSPEGESTYSTGVVVTRPDGGMDRGASIAVIEPAAYQLGQPLRAEGRAYVTPYVTDAGRLGLSFLVERLVPVEARAAAKESTR